MIHREIREKFIKFFEERGHKLVPSSSLLPTDPSVLFTTAGMQQFKPYYTGEADPMKDFGSLNTVSVQKCLRISDIEQVGDNFHLTFLEMLGNFSFGGYFKEKAIQLAHEFIIKEVGLKIDYVSIFAGEENVPADEESEKIWKSLDPKIEVRKFGRADNFWGPTGDEGPCGPTSEIYVDGIEVWNLVFNQYYQKKDKTLEPLKIPGIDTGMGLERLVMVLQKKSNIFETDLFEPIIKLIPQEIETRIKRIIADHVRAVTFLTAEGIIPSNKVHGYVLRKLIRRILAHQHSYYQKNIKIDIYNLITSVINVFKEIYPKLNDMVASGTLMDEAINNIVNEEKEKFDQTLEKSASPSPSPSPSVSENEWKAQELFRLTTQEGIPLEIATEKMNNEGNDIDDEVMAIYNEKIQKHKDLSRTASAGMFKGGLADTSEQTIRLHTAAHLMLEALRQVLGGLIQQKGSNITSERLRFDFSHGEKLTPEQIKQVEEMVNEQIERNLPVHFEEMSVDEAKKIGATGVFEHKYGDKVKVYFVGNEGNYFSKEICGGPHVAHTGEIGKFKIIKEESVSTGTRRIRATIED